MNNIPEAWYTLDGPTPAARRRSISNTHASFLKRFGAFPTNPRLFRIGRTIYIGYPMPKPEEPEPEEPEFLEIYKPAQQLSLLEVQ